MTDSDIKYGCLSKSLENFLLMNKEKRDKIYGKGKAKYYQRIVRNVEESFRDAVIAYNYLPPEYSRKINLNTGFGMIQDEIIKQKSNKDKANFAIMQARKALGVINNELQYDESFTIMFENDFIKVQNWLTFLDKIDPDFKMKK